VTHKGVIHYTVDSPDSELAPIHKELELYITVGLHPSDRRPRELFIRDGEKGHAYDPWATAVSLILQMEPGSLPHLLRKFAHIRQEPSGMSENPLIGFAKSPYDYIARWMAAEFLTREEAAPLGVLFPTEEAYTEGAGI
jgi:hypothetical protein